MGKPQFRLRLSRKSNRELNPVEKWRRKQKDNQKLRRIVSRLSHGDNPTQRRPKTMEEENPGQDPMLGELMTTTQLRKPGNEQDSESESPPREQEVTPKPQPGHKPEKDKIELVPTSVLVPRQVSSQMEVPNDPEASSDSEDLDSLAVSTFETQVARPTQQAPVFRQQTQFQRMLEDPDMAEFYKAVGDLL